MYNGGLREYVEFLYCTTIEPLVEFLQKFAPAKFPLYDRLQGRVVYYMYDCKLTINLNIVTPSL